MHSGKGYVGNSEAYKYKACNMGLGQRYDFTQANVKDKGDYKYDYARMGSIKTEIERLKR